MSWVSNKDPEDLWNLFEGCQVIEFGGWPKGVVPIKYSGGVRDNDTLDAIDTDNTKGTTKKRPYAAHSSSTTTHTLVASSASSALTAVDELLEQRRMKTTKGTTKKQKREATTTGVATVPTSLSMFLSSSKEVKRSRKYFDRQFGVAFKPKEEIQNNTATVIPESDPKAIFEASKTNTTISLTIAPAEHDLDCHQVCGTLPVSKTVRRAFATGHGICLITTLLNYYLGINKEKFHTLRSISSHLSPDLPGGIHQNGFEKALNQWAEENVWMGALRAVPWVVGYAIKNQQQELQQCDNQLVCIVIPRGDPRLDLFHQFGAPGWYKDYVNPVKSPFIVPVFWEDTVGFPANAIPQFIADAPEHPTSVVPLQTEEQKLERSRAYQRSYNQQHQEQKQVYDRS